MGGPIGVDRDGLPPEGPGSVDWVDGGPEAAPADAGGEPQPVSASDGGAGAEPGQPGNEALRATAVGGLAARLRARGAGGGEFCRPPTVSGDVLPGQRLDAPGADARLPASRAGFLRGPRAAQAASGAGTAAGSAHDSAGAQPPRGLEGAGGGTGSGMSAESRNIGLDARVLRRTARLAHQAGGLCPGRSGDDRGRCRRVRGASGAARLGRL